MSRLNVILRADIDGLGKRGDVVEVSKGYVRNYLEPNGLAIPASDGAIAQAAAMRQAREVRDAREREEGDAIAQALVPKTIEVAAKVGAAGRLFGSITEADIVEAIVAQTGIELDRKSIHLDEHIKDLGSHQATAKLAQNVQFPISIEVVAAE